MDLNTVLLGGFAAAFMVSFLVFVHEAGHFLVAKAFGVGVPVFSLGMGQRIWGFEYKGTDYRISALPVGGYVQLAGADPFGEADMSQSVDPEEDFLKKPVWVRLAVMLAGPGMNLILPVVLFTGVFLYGVPQQGTAVGTVNYGSDAWTVGIRSGDVIKSVEGEPMDLWSDLLGVLGDRAGIDTQMTLQRPDGTVYTVTLPGEALRPVAPSVLDATWLGVSWPRRGTSVGVASPDSPMGKAGLKTGDIVRFVDDDEVNTWSGIVYQLQAAPGPHTFVVDRWVTEEGGLAKKQTLTLEQPEPSSVQAWTAVPGDPFGDLEGLVPVELYIAELKEGMPAEVAGFQPDDRVFAVNGVPVRDFYHVMRLVGESVGATSPDASAEPDPIRVTLLRDGKPIDVQLTPQMHRELIFTNVYWRPVIGYMGYPSTLVAGDTFIKDYSVGEAVSQAAYESKRVFDSTIDAFGKLFVGEIKPQESLGGPIEIVRQAAEGARQGLFSYVARACAISISLGVVNLLPVPVLDGGQILFFLIEGIRGRPLSLVLRERLQMVGVLALVALMLMVMVFDVNRLLGG